MHGMDIVCLSISSNLPFSFLKDSIIILDAKIQLDAKTQVIR